MVRTSFVAVWGVVFALAGASLHAQEGPLTAMYGKGVHLYFSGAAFQANDAFTAAIDGGSADPRVYFYRGLNYLRLGREPEAMADFSKGAALEAAAPGYPFDVSQALVRIQGGSRMAIERARAKARLDAVAAARQQQQRRYEEMQTEPATFLGPPAAPGSAPPAMTPPAAADPFGDAPPATAPGAAPASGDNPPSASTPAEPAPMPVAPPAGADPFNTPPPPQTIAEPPVEKPEADPFGTPNP